MTELTIKEIQAIEIDILDSISNICKENNLDYFLVGGALLGAFRTGKLLPWDDDIDLFMPRKDYEKFLNVYKNNGEYKILDCRSNLEYYYPFAKVIDEKTVFFENVDKYELKQLPFLGVGVDVFPLDSLPKGKQRKKYLKIKQSVIQALCYKNCRNKSTKQISQVKHSALKVAESVLNLHGDLPKTYISEMEKLWQGFETGFGRVDTWDWHEFPEECFVQSSSIALNDKIYSCPSNLDCFLRICYGDSYMVPVITEPDGHGKAYRK